MRTDTSRLNDSVSTVELHLFGLWVSGSALAYGVNLSRILQNWHALDITGYRIKYSTVLWLIQCVPLATEPGISLIILTPIKVLLKVLQRNLKRSTFVVWEMKRNVSVVRFKFCCNILISGKIIKEMPGSVASGIRCRTHLRHSPKV